MRDVGATMISRRHWGGPALWLGIPLLVVILAFVIAMSMFARACSNMGQIGDGSVGVSLRNDCERTILARAADSRETIDDRLRAPTRIPPGDRRGLVLVTNVAYEPDAYFLAFTTVGAGQPVVIREFDLDELEHEEPHLRVEPDCVTLTAIED